MRFKLFIGIGIMAIALLTSCKAIKNDEDQEKLKDLEYTVLDNDNLPEVVATKIEAEKMNPFKFSYTDGDSTYIAIGYGEQPTGGYSIQVNEIYKTEAYVVIKTTLLEPSEKDLAVTVLTYPYIVIQTKNQDLPVCFK